MCEIPLLIETDLQSEILVHLKAHLRVERTLGKEVMPAMNRSKTSDKFLQAETCKFAKSSIVREVRMLIRMI
jgi:dephospho-CoA kinase